MQQIIWMLQLFASFALFGKREAPAPPNPAIARAMESIALAVPKADADPTRPLYHFHAPAQWMNDPNGPIYHDGYYHLFYQHNPYGDTWGHMHWGHARSRDLIRWQHLPEALWPSTELGEEHVFSGCALVPPKGPPMIFYTSIGRNKPAEVAAEQWVAVGDKSLATWQKHPNNPILSEQLHGTTKIYDWRDPFVFQDQNRTYMVLGGNLNERKGGQAVVALYRADDPSLTRWQYLGILFTHPDPKVVNIECPNFFKLGDRWILLVSPHGPTEYFVGDFDLTSFTFKMSHRSLLDNSADYYAPNGLVDPRGRRLIWGWIRGFESGRGWNGCLSLPRVLSLGPHGELLQKPAPELRRLRGEHLRLTDVTVDHPTQEIPELKGDSLEIYADIDLLDADVFQLQLRRSADGGRSVLISYSAKELTVAGVKIPFQLEAGEKTLKLDVFLDRSVLEVFANNRECFTRVLRAESGDLGVSLGALGGTALVRSFHAWQMRPLR